MNTPSGAMTVSDRVRLWWLLKKNRLKQRVYVWGGPKPWSWPPVYPVCPCGAPLIICEHQQHGEGKR